MPESTDGSEDPIASLREHLRGVRETTERLLRDWGEGPHEQTPPSASGTATPPNGWETIDTEQARQSVGELQALVDLIHSLRELLPHDIQAQVIELVRQLLVLLGALLEVLAKRLDRREQAPRESVEVHDIPIV